MQPNSVALTTRSSARANSATPLCTTSTIIHPTLMSQEPEA
jgi:hypothetical protein